MVSDLFDNFKLIYRIKLKSQKLSSRESSVLEFQSFKVQVTLKVLFFRNTEKIKNFVQKSGNIVSQRFNTIFASKTSKANTIAENEKKTLNEVSAIFNLYFYLRLLKPYFS